LLLHTLRGNDLLVFASTQRDIKNVQNAFDESRNEPVATGHLGKLLRAVRFNLRPEELVGMTEDLG
jgi:hypothetical protein